MEREEEVVVHEAAAAAAAEGRLELTIDEVFERYVGSLGLSQVLHVLIVTLAWVFDAQNTLITIFTDAQPTSWRCKINPNITNASSISSTWCMINDNTSSSGTGTKAELDVCGLAAGTWEWIGGNTTSTIAEWGLICDRKFLPAVPTSLFFVGSIIGCAFYGKLADTWLGRKKTLLLACILTSATTFVTSFSPNVWIYSLLRFVNGFTRSGTGICCLVLSTELVGRKWRGQVGQYGFFFFTFGFLSLPFIAYPTRHNWRDMYRIISILPLVCTFLLVPLASESPRWLIVRGKKEEALDVLRKLARRNGKKLPENLELVVPSQGTTTGNKNENIWTTPWAAKRMITLMLSAFGIGFVYYGIQLNSENLNFNLYLTVIINALMEIPGVFIGSILLSFTSGRLLLMMSAVSAGVASLLCIIFSTASATRGKAKSGGGWPQLTVEAIGFMAASIAFNVSYVYCVELFPTSVRNFSVSFLRQSLFLGASLSPLLVVIGRLSPTISFIVFGVLSIVSGILCICLPETRNAPLYETLKQQEEEEKQRRLTATATVV